MYISSCAGFGAQRTSQEHRKFKDTWFSDGRKHAVLASTDRKWPSVHEAVQHFLEAVSTSFRVTVATYGKTTDRFGEADLPNFQL